MIIWLPLTLAIAEECPTSDLYAHKLDAYTIELGDVRVQFRMVIDEETVIEPEVEMWTTMLQACRAHQTLGHFESWQISWNNLASLGVAYQSARLREKWRLSREIRDLERETVIQYAQMLHRLELETGISVLWNVEEHPLAKGMVSGGRGSPKVYEYIFNQYNFVQYNQY